MFASPNLEVSHRSRWVEHLREFKAAGGYRSSREVAAAFASRPKLWRQMLAEGGFSAAELDAAELEIRRECSRFQIAVQD